MKEIKFRAWDLDNGGMWYSDRDCSDGEWGKNWVIDRQGIHFEEMALDNLIEGGEAVQRERWHTPKQVAMQFTGLNDKNGVPIYEGDIVRKNYGPNEFDGDDCIEDGVVGWVDGGFWFVKKDHTYYNLKSSPLEVIGNIHENPELVNP